jgi:hypothetical protein
VSRPLVRLKAVPGGLPLGAILAGIGVLAAIAVGLLHLDSLPFTVCFFKFVTGCPARRAGARAPWADSSTATWPAPSR